MPAKKKAAKKKVVKKQSRNPLTAKRITFAFEYMVDKNAKAAAERAGFSKKTSKQIGSQLLKVPEIQAIIKSGLARVAEKAETDAVYVLKTSRELVERCMQHEPVMEKIDGELVPTGEYKFDSAGAGKGLKLIGDHIDVKAFDKTVEHNASKELLEFLNNIPSTTGPPSER